MRIPDGPAGVPTVSASQIRTYGAGGFELEDQEDDRGCPHLYWAKYVADEPLPRQEDSYPLKYGQMFHQVMYAMEQDQLDPDQALLQAWDASLPLSAFEEARADLEAYMSRGSAPRDRYLTLAVEIELDGVLFVTESGEEVRYRGIIDWIGLDPEDPSTLHVVDYKTNRAPFSAAQIYGDVQMRGYDWLVRQNSQRWVTGPANVVTHLDGIKFREVEARFSDDQIEDWQAWATAVVTQIMRDEEHLPVINPHCPFCPIRDACPEFAKLPETAAALAAEKPQGDADKLAWRDRANRIRLTLEKSVKAIDSEFAKKADVAGGLVVGKMEWARVIDWVTVIDLRRMHSILGDRFYDAASVSRASLERLPLDPSTFDEAMSCFGQAPNGMKIIKKGIK